MPASDSDTTLNSQTAGSTTVLSVPLRRNRESASASAASLKPPVWAVDQAIGQETVVPLPAKCSRHDLPGGVCCKELKEDDERTLVNPDIVRDVVIGLSDGLTVPFALAAGLSSLGTSRIVVLGGVAELIAGAISMGIGGFLAAQAERDHYHYLHRFTALRVIRSCAGEMEREVHAVLGPVGVDEKTSRAVAKCLREVEDTMRPEEDCSQVNGDVETGVMARWSKDVGLTAFLLKFGEGLEDVTLRQCFVSAFTIGAGYLVGGIIPLMPYFFIEQAPLALIYSCVVTLVVLLIFGAVKARVTGSANGIGGYVWGAVSTMFVGGAAAAAAFAIVKALESSE